VPHKVCTFGNTTALPTHKRKHATLIPRPAQYFASANQYQPSCLSAKLPTFIVTRRRILFANQCFVTNKLIIIISNKLLKMNTFAGLLVGTTYNSYAFLGNGAGVSVLSPATEFVFSNT
jgi:hypothetical protein